MVPQTPGGVAGVLTAAGGDLELGTVVGKPVEACKLLQVDQVAGNAAAFVAGAVEFVAAVGVAAAVAAQTPSLNHCLGSPHDHSQLQLQKFSLWFEH